MNESQKTSSFWDQLNNSKLLRYLLFLALGWGIAQVLAYFEPILVIFIFSGIFAFLLNYPVQWVCRFMPRGPAVITVFVLSLLIVAGLTATLGLAIVSQSQQLLDQSPQLTDTAISLLDSLQEILARWNLNVDFTTIEEQLQTQALSTLGFGLTALQSILANVLNLIIIAVISFFMLLDGARLWNFILQRFPNHFQDRLTHAIRQNFLGFFWGRLLLSIFFGLSAFLVFIILQIPYALVLATTAGVFDLIPGIGATIGITLVSIITLPQGIWLSLKVLVGCILLQQIEENLLMPRIMQGSINMNPVVLFFALLVGARIAGLVGVFLSIPIAGVLISLFDIKEMQGTSHDTPEQQDA
ncbi:AI-2E family transporter [filamentous cyanobacterium CCP2]|nr:AI-2E family transporter [filamentous cyanobacterium CCP2]